MGGKYILHVILSQLLARFIPLLFIFLYIRASILVFCPDVSSGFLCFLYSCRFSYLLTYILTQQLMATHQHPPDPTQITSMIRTTQRNQADPRVLLDDVLRFPCSAAQCFVSPYGSAHLYWKLR
jgi:hypothetical protein